jgi:hypothetical protein
MVMPREVFVPSTEQFASALADFTRTIEAVTRARASEYGPAWLAASPHLAGLAALDAQQIVDDADFIQWLGLDIEAAPTAYAILWAELFAVNYIHRELSGFIFDEELAPVDVMYFQDDASNPWSERTVKDLEVVQGSVEKIIDRLPPWLKKLMEAMMELLKLSRGVIG